jgi:hypothetical protein
MVEKAGFMPGQRNQSGDARIFATKSPDIILQRIL